MKVFIIPSYDLKLLIKFDNPANILDTTSPTPLISKSVINWLYPVPIIGYTAKNIAIKIINLNIIQQL
tara:strand:+ start:298 stop:501 length:204 start_codon:yes stop_codon:yes gene_type:complete